MRAERARYPFDSRKPQREVCQPELAGPPRVVYVEPVAVGDMLPDMPLFLKPEFYVPAPLETTYEATWQVFPAPLKGLLETPGTGTAEKPSNGENNR